MDFEEFISNTNATSVALSEGSIFERLRRDPAVEYDTYIFHASLIYNDHARQVLEAVHREYVDVAQKYHLPIYMLTDTWRTSAERIESANFKRNKVNQDNARFLSDLRDGYGERKITSSKSSLLEFRCDCPKREDFQCPEIHELA